MHKQVSNPISRNARRFALDAKNQIELGEKVRDIVTGFTGIAMARVEYLNGCVQFCVKPMAKKVDCMPDGHYIDIGQLERVRGGILGLIQKATTGGVMPDEPPGI